MGCNEVLKAVSDMPDVLEVQEVCAEVLLPQKLGFALKLAKASKSRHAGF